jgi:hypothetical protein
MEKEDYQWLMLALGILLVVGVIIKPALTHEEPNFQIPQFPALPPLRMPTPLAIVTTQPVTIGTTQPVITIQKTTPAIPAVPTTTTEPVPTASLIWNGSKQTIEFVDPGTYNVSLITFVPRNLSQTLSPYRITDYTSLLASPITGQYSGTTQVINIPFPYWELWYTVQPTSSDLRQQAEGSGMYEVSPTQGEGVSMSGVSGSYSTVMPTFSIDVIDADNPSSIVRTITPPGNLDPLLWQKDDPRPWKEKFLEGNNQYYFIIRANTLSSYSIDIKVPTSYLEKI